MSLAGSWRQYSQRYRLAANKNKESGKIFFPPRLICNESRSREFSPVELATTGVIETYTVVRTPTSEFTDESPVILAIVKLDDGVKIHTQVVDADLNKVAIGDKVRVEFRKMTEDGDAGIIYYSYKVVPA